MGAKQGRRRIITRLLQVSLEKLVALFKAGASGRAQTTRPHEKILNKYKKGVHIFYPASPFWSRPAAPALDYVGSVSVGGLPEAWLKPLPGD